MRLLRVQVPEFRALKGVDISFEPEFTPQVFPLGSLNGGGKSTLLQLIFVLLHCLNADKEVGYKYLKNIVSDIKKTDEKINKLAEIRILASERIVDFYYLYGDENEIRELSEQNEGNLSYQPYSSKINEYSFGDIFFMVTINMEEKNDDNIEPGLVLHNLVSEIREKFFLISPSNQSYIFFPKKERLSLALYGNETDKKILELKNELPNFFTYDFIDLLTEFFRLARDKDYDEKLKTGAYGTHSDELEKLINNLFLDGKKIVPLTVQQKRHTKDSIQSMGFKLSDGTEIYPEDLSHGELKRLTIFTIIKSLENSIVLMDEIENGFHPRWQRYIVDDLVEWGASNQYILATHSYEVCRGISFGHIKELAPKLMPESSE